LSFFDELKRRNVFKVALAYIVMAWLVMQVADVILNNIEAPGWVFEVILLLLGIGFLFSMFFAWAFELTPEGLRREHEVDRSRSITHQTSRKLDFIIIGIMAVALGYFTYDRFTLSPGREVALVEAGIRDATDEATDQVEAAAFSNKSIAVLPFDNRSADEENAEFFAAGVHDELLTSLSKLGELRVISRTSVESLDANLSIPEIGALLNVATVLEGQVQRAGDQVRINVQLIDAGTDEHMWAEIYDRKLTATNIFLIQSEIATAIAAALRSKLTPQEQEQLDVIPTENLAALEAYFLGKQSMAKRTRVALLQAVSYFKKAIELDPGFALAYIGQAIAITAQTDNSGLPPQEAFALAEPLIKKALELDDQSGEAYASLGMIYGYIGDRDAAETAFRRALELSPNYVGAHHGYSMFLRELGYYDVGLEQINEAIRLDPLSAVAQVNLGTVLFELGRPEDALTQFKKVVALDPAYPPGHWSVGALYWTGFGQLDKALVWLKQAVKNNPGDAITPAWLGLLYLDLGDETAAVHWINKALELGPESPIPNWAMEMLLVYQGENTQAKEYANKVLQQDPNWALSLADLRNQDLQAGRVVDASARYEKQFPALFNYDDPMIDRSNVQAAINLGLIMTSLGQAAHANLLLDRSLDYAESTTIPRLHWYPFAYGIPQQVQIYALQGKTQKSLEALRQAIDNGWRGLWWYWLEHDPNLDSIRQEPEFQALAEEIRADMAAQLERARAMQAKGELESIPDIN
jgi:TolB-like protein/Tfp pilus assembly protein PilF